MIVKFDKFFRKKILNSFEEKIRVKNLILKRFQIQTKVSKEILIVF